MSSKNKNVEFENSKLSKINETEISKVISENSLAEDKHSCSLELKSSAKIKAQFDIFLQRKTELEAELKELLCYEKDDNVQPATLKLRAIDLKERLTSLGVSNWINKDLDHDVSNWEDQISKSILGFFMELRKN